MDRRLSREEMLDQINENLQEATDDVVEQAYWFLMMEMST